MKKVTIIIPTYKRSNNLERAIRSCLNQTYMNIEILIIDDNGEKTKEQQETKNKINNLIDGSKVKYIVHKNNKGGSAARNTGIKNSQGDYIAFLDDDDEYYPKRIEILVKELEKNFECIGILSNFSKVIKSREIVGIPLKSKEPLKDLLRKQYDIGTGSNLFFKKNILEELNGFKEEFKRHQDLELLGRALRIGEIKFINKVLVRKYTEGHRNYPTSLTIIQTKEKYLSLFSDEIEKFSLKEKNEIFKVHNDEIIEICFVNGNFKLAINFLKKSREKNIKKFKKAIFIGILRKTLIAKPVYKFLKKINQNL